MTDLPTSNGTGRVAFVCAMPMELAPLRRKLRLQRRRLASLSVHEGTLGGRPVVAVVSGMGTARAGVQTERLLDALDVEHVVVVGIAGAVEEDAAIGALVLPEEVADAASGARYRPDPLGSGEARGILWTSDDLITDPVAVARLRDVGVVALDMETAAVAEVCTRRQTAWSVFRCFSDRTADAVVDEDILRLSRPDGTPDTRAVLSYVARRPGRIPVLVATARDAKTATERAADHAIEALSARP
jgi:adenosylhomocysteine nucleosidase